MNAQGRPWDIPLLLTARSGQAGSELEDGASEIWLLCFLEPYGQLEFLRL